MRATMPEVYAIAAFTTALANHARLIGAPHQQNVNRLVMDLVKLGKLHNRLRIDQCNRELSDKEQLSLEICKKQIQELGSRYEFGVVFETDPRGFTVRLQLRLNMEELVDVPFS